MLAHQMKRLLAVGLVSLFAIRAAVGQTQQGMSSPALARADSAFAQNSWQAAASGYEAVVKDAPRNGMAWFRLGASLEQLGRSDDAVSAYGHAISVGFQPVQAEFRTARIYAKQGNTKAAIDHLRPVATAGVDPSMFDKEPAFASLRGTPDFAAVAKLAGDTRYPCRNEHTFDFWVGDFTTAPWNQPNAQTGGELHNTREYEGCVIVERFSSPSNGGMSIAFYDANRKVWRMIWNDDANSSNDFEGSYHDGAMRFEGWVLDAEGNKMLARNVLENVSPDVIRHIYSTSSDGGKTWVVRSDGRFARKK